jgi:hypothetical protein
MRVTHTYGITRILNQKSAWSIIVSYFITTNIVQKHIIRAAQFVMSDIIAAILGIQNKQDLNRIAKPPVI